MNPELPTATLVRPPLWTRLALIVPLLWTAAGIYLMVSTSHWQGEKSRREALADHLAGMEKALNDLSQGSIVLWRTPLADDSMSRWKELYQAYRVQVKSLDGKDPAVQEVIEPLSRLYAYVVQSERLRLQLLSNNLPEAEARVLEAEFRTKINLALTELKGIILRLRSQPPVEGPRRDGIWRGYLAVSIVLGVALGALLWLYGWQVLRWRRADRAFEECTANVRDTETLLGRLLSSVSEAVVILDGEGQIRHFNPAAEALLGYREQEILGHAIRTILPAPSGTAARGDAPGLTEGRRKDGKTVRLEVSSRKAELAQGSLEYLFLRPAAIKAEPLARVAEEPNQAVARLTAKVAQVFSNLLTTITGYSELALEALEASHPARNDLERIKEAGERAAGLVHQMLAFASRQVVQPRLVDLNSRLLALESRLKASLGPNVRLQLDLSRDLAKISADPAHLDQAMLVLAANAKEAMPEGGIFTLRTANAEAAEIEKIRGEGADPHLVLQASDTGPGLKPEAQRHLFQPFFTTKDPSKSMGLGLATVYGIVRECGGVIRATSVPGGGATFTIYLPSAKAGAAAKAGASATA